MAARSLRAERFCSAEPVKLARIPTNDSFGDSQKWGSKFIREWIDRNEATVLKSTSPRYTEIIDQAIKGKYYR
jgi:hypothetical protein